MENKTSSSGDASTGVAKKKKKSETASFTQVSLTTARKILWKGNPPTLLAWFLNPLRVYIMDPVLAINSVLSPVVVPRFLDPFLSKCVTYLMVPLLSCVYRSSSTTSPTSNNTDNKDSQTFGQAAKRAIVQPSVVSVHPPSDFQSAFQGGVSFLCSAIGDIAGLLTNPKKFTGWMEALSQFNTFLESTGVGDEMEEAIQKPLLTGRLLDNFKILNDIQQVHHYDRMEQAQMETESQRNEGFQQDVERGHRFMRFATAAYGTEMIRSAVDEDIDASQFLQDDSQYQAIALHTKLPLNKENVKDTIAFVHSGNDHDYDQHVLHHFCALDHKEKAIILAIRGTLSLSGAIVDIQGMAADFCEGGAIKAHKGISEMAENLWNESGEKIKDLMMTKYPDYKLIITGHSLGAGTSCLLTMYLYANGIFPSHRKIECFAFAPPPTFFHCDPDKKKNPALCAKVDAAIQNTVAYIHDNDVVPFLSVAAVRRMVNLLDAVDNETEKIWFWRRWKIFYGYAPVPEQITSSVLAVEKAMADGTDAVTCSAVDGECNMIIPARRVVWCKHKFGGSKQFEAFSCDPVKVSEGNIFLTPDMISDHLPEQYEDALDSVLEQIQRQK